MWFQRAKSSTFSLLHAVATGYAVLVFLLWLLQWRLGEETLGVGLIKSVLHLLFIPALVLLPFGVLLGKKRLTALLTLCVLAFIFSWGEYFVPRGGRALPTSPTFRIMTYNMERPAADETADLVAIVRAGNADVVAIQELTPAGSVALIVGLQDLYPYHALHPKSDYTGQGIFSRFPIEEDRYWHYDDLPGALGHQRVQLCLHGQPVVLYNVHPVPPVTYRHPFNAAAHRAALARVLEMVNEEELPTLLAGDFNMTDQFHGYRELRRHFVDAYRAVGEIGFGFTFPNKANVPLPALVRIDYIFYDRTFRGLEAQTWPETGSADHAPVVVDLALPAAAGSSPSAPPCR